MVFFFVCMEQHQQRAKIHINLDNTRNIHRLTNFFFSKNLHEDFFFCVWLVYLVLSVGPLTVWPLTAWPLTVWPLTTCLLRPRKAAEDKTFNDILLTETFNCRLKFRFSSTFFLNKKLMFYHFCPPKLKPLWPLWPLWPPWPLILSPLTFWPLPVHLS